MCGTVAPELQPCRFRLVLLGFARFAHMGRLLRACRENRFAAAGAEPAKSFLREAGARRAQACHMLSSGFGPMRALPLCRPRRPQRSPPGAWQSLAELGIAVEHEASAVRGVVALSGLRAALDALKAGCPRR